MPKVSVIIPVYGVEQYIEKCARSLFEQTLDDIEYIFVNDCTPDHSMDVLASVMQDYPHRIPQVRIIDMPQNSGQAAVRKTGILAATGEYYIHCDSDDWVDVTMYEKLYYEAKRKNADVVFCDMWHMEPGHEWVAKHKLKSLSKDYIMQKLLSTPEYNSTCSALVNTSLIKKVQFPEGNHSEDKTLMIQLCWFANGFSLVPEPLYYYRYVQSSISNTQDKKKQSLRTEQVLQNVSMIQSFAKIVSLNHKNKKAFQAYLFNSKFDFLLNATTVSDLKYWSSVFNDETKFWAINHCIDVKTKIVSFIHIVKVITNRKG